MCYAATSCRTRRRGTPVSRNILIARDRLEKIHGIQHLLC
jgi:hypothetical protein